MTLKHWAWIMSGLVCWAVLVYIWSISPDICDQPAARHSAHCENRR